MRKKILIAITTYKRPYVKANFKKILWVKGEQYFGKSRYWMLIDKLFKLIKNRDFDYAIQIPDDIRLVDEFFSKAIDLYESINSHNIACLNILQDKRTSLPMWTPVEQEDIGAVLKTGWVDMCYIARKNFFEALEYTIYRVALSWAGDPNKSSGVGKQISERLYKHLNFFHVKDSLVTHGAHESVMHPLHRKTVPLVANNRKDKVIAGMASIPERTGSLKKVVDSIINQVDELHIYLNNYEEIPHFLNRDKVTAYLSNYEKGDLGDIGKFYNVEKATGYFLSISFLFRKFFTLCISI